MGIWNCVLTAEHFDWLCDSGVGILRQIDALDCASQNSFFQLLCPHDHPLGAEIGHKAAISNHRIILRNHTGCIIRHFLELSTKIYRKLL